jgi:hypothetical protein
MMIVLIPLLVCIAGGALHLLSPRLATLGGYAFAVGLFWTLAVAAHHVVRLL